MANTELKALFNDKLAIKPQELAQAQPIINKVVGYANKTKKVNRQVSMTDRQFEKLQKLAVTNGYTHKRYGQDIANVSGYLQELIDNLPEPPEAELERQIDLFN